MRRLATLLAGLVATAAMGQARLSGELSFVEPIPTPGLAREAARIEVRSVTSDLVLDTWPSQDGRFRLEPVPPGVYQVSASHPRGLGAVTYLEIGPSGDYHLELRLASRATATVATIFWVVLALSLTVAFASGILLYGLGRVRGGRDPRRRRERLVPLGSVTVALLLWCAAFLVFGLVAPMMQPGRGECLNPLSAVIGALLTGCVVLSLVQLRPRPLSAGAAVAAGWALALSAATVDLAPAARGLCIGVGIMVWTTAAGWLLSLGLRRHSYVVLAAVTVAVCDFWAVFYGATGHVVQSTAAADQFRVAVQMLPWPVLGSEVVNPTIGVGDFLFLAFFLCTALRLELGIQRNFLALMCAFVIGLILTPVVAAAYDVPGLPALPFLSAFFLLANRARLAVGKEDRRRIGLFVLGLAVVLAVLSLIRRSPELPSEGTAPPETGRSADWPWDIAALRAIDPTPKVSRGRGPDGTQQTRLEFALPGGDRRSIAGGVLAARRGVPVTAAVLLPGGAAGLAGAVQHEVDVVLALDGLGLTDDGPPSFESLRRAGDRAILAGTALRRQYPSVRSLLLAGDGWGAVLALAVASRDDGFDSVIVQSVGALDGGAGAAARSLDGLPPGERANWLAAFAPETSAAGLAAPTLLIQSALDTRWPLDDGQRVFGALSSPSKRWRLLIGGETDDASTRRAVGDWCGTVCRGASPGRAPSLSTSVTGDRDRQSLRIAADAADERPQLVIGRGPGELPGYDWRTAPSEWRHESGWSIDLALDGDAAAIVASATYSSELVRLSGAQLPVRRALWPERATVVVSGWYAAEPPPVLVAVGDGPGRVRLVTHALGALRWAAAAGASDRLELTWALARADGFELVAVEGWGCRAERRVPLARLGGAGRRWVFGMTPSEAGVAPVDWARVDGLLLELTPAWPVDHHTDWTRAASIRLAGGLAGIVEGGR